MSDISCELGNYIAALEFYINKLTKKRVVKVMNQEDGRPALTIKKIEDILHKREDRPQLVQSEKPHKKSTLLSAQGPHASMDSKRNSDETIEDCGERLQVVINLESAPTEQFHVPPMFSSIAQHMEGSDNENGFALPLDENLEMERMTLKEMQCHLKKSAQKRLRKLGKSGSTKKSETSYFPMGISTEVNGPHSSASVISKCKRSVDGCAVTLSRQGGKFGETFVEGPGEDIIESCVGETCYEQFADVPGKLKDLVDDSEYVEGACEASEKGKAGSYNHSVVMGPSQVAENQDQWTLEMWQSFHRQQSRSQAYKKHNSAPSKNLPNCSKRQRVHLPAPIYSDISMDSSPESCFTVKWEQTAQLDEKLVRSPKSENEVSVEAISKVTDHKSPESSVTSEKAYSVVASPCSVNTEACLDLDDKLELGISRDCPENSGVAEQMEDTYKIGKLKHCSNLPKVISDTVDLIGISNRKRCSGATNERDISGGDTSVDYNIQGDCHVTGEYTNVILPHSLNLHWPEKGRKDPLVMNRPIDACLSDEYRHLERPDSKEPVTVDQMIPKPLSGITDSATKESRMAVEVSNSPVPRSVTFPMCNNVLASSIIPHQDLGKSGEFCDAVAVPATGMPTSMSANEGFDVEDRGPTHRKPVKIPCKRKAISPLSRQKLLHAIDPSQSTQMSSHDSESLAVYRGLNGFAALHKDKDAMSQDCVGSSRMKTMYSQFMSNMSCSPDQSKEGGHVQGTYVGSPCHNKEPCLPWRKSLSSKLSHFRAPLFSSLNHVGSSVPSCHQHSQLSGQKHSHVLNKSPPHVKISLVESKSAVGSSPLPPKGILRSSSRVCQGMCKCDECVSLRSRSRKASEFSQRQMHDIEGLAMKLIKDLNTLRTIVEERVLSESKSVTPNSNFTLEQVKTATCNACETEEMTKKWLAIMARDCNRYCKIMRMQQRKLAFADEAGGQLCQVKLFHSQMSSKSPLVSVSDELEPSDSDMHADSRAVMSPMDIEAE
eukprot:c23742_g1_i2 orf=517-3516(-)